MIHSKNDLKKILKYEKNIYFNNSFAIFLRKKISSDEEYLIYKYIKYLRLSDWYFNEKKWIPHMYYRRKKNRLGAMLGISISHDLIGKGLRIWHYGSIIINGKAKIGENCQFHGNNCIGNKGIGYENDVPIIGNNVDVGVGACIIGKIYVADNIRIGANAFYEKGITIAGIPAKKMKEENKLI